MTDMPEKIWASPEHPDENGYGGFWIKAKVAPSVEYTRSDIAWNEALEAAAKNMDALGYTEEIINNHAGAEVFFYSAKFIRAMKREP